MLHTMHEVNIDTLEITFPFTGTDAFMNTFTHLPIKYCSTEAVYNNPYLAHILGEIHVTYFSSSDDLLPYLYQGLT